MGDHSVVEILDTQDFVHRSSVGHNPGGKFVEAGSYASKVTEHVVEPSDTNGAEMSGKDESVKVIAGVVDAILRQLVTSDERHADCSGLIDHLGSNRGPCRCESR